MAAAFSKDELRKEISGKFMKMLIFDIFPKSFALCLISL